MPTDLDQLIQYLQNENPHLESQPIPSTLSEKKNRLRALVNIRPPKPIDEEFLRIEARYLQAERMEKGITNAHTLPTFELHPKISLWQGDITTLKVEAIVNAANTQMLGCFHPNHRCIDNAIHTYAGVELRLACHALMQDQGHNEPTGSAKITPAFHLPSDYVLHTVGPIVYGALTDTHCEQLAKCYHNCLTLAEKNNITRIAFCCISTGEFHFPNEKAAEIAIHTVTNFLSTHQKIKQVIFNVFKDEDFNIYNRLLNQSHTS